MVFTDVLLNNRYQLQHEIGHGGMGTVFAALDRVLNRTVAVKVLPHYLVQDTELLSRFQREIYTTAQLEHPHIVHIFDVGEDADVAYYVMQYINGGNLHATLTEHHTFTLAEALPLLRQVAAALDYAHQTRLIHRDIKPANLLIDEHGHAYVSDFGIVRSLEGTHHTVGLIGTPVYMSPEQCRGEELTGASDQYSLAVIAYEMLTGNTPFRQNGEAWAVLNQHLSTPAPDPRTLCPTLPDAAAKALQRALAKLPPFRFSTCSAFIEALAGEEHIADAPTVLTAAPTVNSSTTILPSLPLPTPLPEMTMPFAMPADEEPAPVQERHPHYARFWPRVFAWGIDVGMIAAVGFLLSYAAAKWLPSLIPSEMTRDMVSMAVISNIIVLFSVFYFTLLEASRVQATLGKLLLGLKVTDLDGHRLTFGQAMTRFCAKLLSWLTLLIGFLMITFTRRKQSLHDIVAHTLVVQRPDYRPTSGRR